LTWKPGETGNPHGRPQYPEDIRPLARITKFHIESLLSKYLSVTVDKLKELEKDASLRAIDAMVVKVALKAIVQGDVLRMNFLLDRLIGKVKEVSEVHNIEYSEAYKIIPREELISLLRSSKQSLPAPKE